MKKKTIRRKLHYQIDSFFNDKIDGIGEKQSAYIHLYI